LIKINLRDLVNPRFYWHFSKSNLYWEQARKLVGGGAQPQFNTGAISQIVIPIPPLTEQQRIVEVLDRFDTLTNDITAGLPAEIEARRKQYEYYRDKLLTFKQK
jgi:type I restriction enzyme S subunit